MFSGTITKHSFPRKPTKNHKRQQIISETFDAILPDFYVSSTSDLVKEVQQHLQDAGCRNEDEDEKID